jgi:1,4-dihydroxy-2-naphthoyl-CoA hydrolase
MAGDTDPQVGMNETLGIEYLGGTAARAEGRFKVTDQVRQPFGIVHGGAFAALAETVCSAATYAAVAEDGMVAMGQSNQASFLRPVSSGNVHCVATARHSGRTTWVWDCELTDDEGRLCSLVRMTIAVRPRPAER